MCFSSLIIRAALQIWCHPCWEHVKAVTTMIFALARISGLYPWLKRSQKDLKRLRYGGEDSEV